MERQQHLLAIIGTSLACITPFGVAAEDFTEHKLTSKGTNYVYYVHKPSTIIKPLPLVVVLHGGGGNGKGLKDTYGFRPMVSSGEFIAVYPSAGKGGWLPDHVTFLDAMIDEVFKREDVDTERLFVTGASRGGLMTFVMVARSKHDIRAAGTVIASQIAGIAEEYPITQPIDFAMIAGTEDPLMPYAGGWGAMRKPRQTGDPGGRVLPVEDVIDLLLRANRITSEPKVSTLGNKDRNDGCTNEVRTWTNLRSGRRVRLVKVEGGGHVVPGGRQYLPKSLIGPACADFDHAEVMWNFFEASGQPAALPKNLCETAM